MRKTILINNEFYHIYNRGVDKRKIFLNSKDYRRFVDSLVVFNDMRNLNGQHFKDLIGGEERKPLVNVVAYCLMPNHFHLMLEQVCDGGITHFLRKLTTSYTMYFNKKYERSGALIQGTFKRSHIATNERLLEMTQYIHSNPRKILPENMPADLKTYPWSSFQEYLGIIDPSPIVMNKEIVLDQFKTPDDYLKFVLGVT